MLSTMLTRAAGVEDVIVDRVARSTHGDADAEPVVDELVVVNLTVHGLHEGHASVAVAVHIIVYCQGTDGDKNTTHVARKVEGFVVKDGRIKCDRFQYVLLVWVTRLQHFVLFKYFPSAWYGAQPVAKRHRVRQQCYAHNVYIVWNQQ